MAKRVNAWRIDTGAGGYLYFRHREKAYAYAANAGNKPVQRVWVVGSKQGIHN
jgi:hypothetical protein